MVYEAAADLAPFDTKIAERVHRISGPRVGTRAREDSREPVAVP